MGDRVMSDKLWLTADHTDRPSPHGQAWDEAWRQRQMKRKYRDALETIARGVEYRNAAPKMDGTFDKHPCLMSRNRMKELAHEAVETNYVE